MRLATNDNAYERFAAEVVRLARLKDPPMHRFATELAAAVGVAYLSRQAIYDWESGRTKVPASVFLAAIDLAGLSPQELMHLWLQRDRVGQADVMASGTSQQC